MENKHLKREVVNFTINKIKEKISHMSDKINNGETIDYIENIHGICRHLRLTIEYIYGICDDDFHNEIFRDVNFANKIMMKSYVIYKPFYDGEYMDFVTKPIPIITLEMIEKWYEKRLEALWITILYYEMNPIERLIIRLQYHILFAFKKIN
jgi:hypothetical protein